MEQTPKRTSAKGKGRTQPTAKGCCCKRSQCIKNYCDCYQSMMVCTQFCRCVGCRNTEERMAVEPRTPSRNSNVIKKDRAAAMSAKAAAAAAKEGFNIPLKPSSVPIAMLPVQQQPTVMAPINIIRMAPDSFNVVLQQVPPEQLIPLAARNTFEIPAAPVTAINPQFAKVEPMEAMDEPDADFLETHNLFAPQINEAQLVCSLIQCTEGEELELNHVQVGRLAIVEFGNCFKEVSEKMFNL
ncbi:hypothetical protein KR054_004112 [Drosophila jambulina]|nr:hypothetical protein KR054_004112 [Drosophila jambulina]